jgi:hypothetical protein
LSFGGENGFELAQRRMVLTANLFDQASDCFEVSRASRFFDIGERRGESSRVNCSSAGFVRVRGRLDCLGVTALHRLLESREANDRIFRERCEQRAEHLAHARFAQLRAEAIDIYAW